MPKKSMYIAEATIDDEQREILNKQIDHSHIVQGCAGSGKSCLALLRVKMLATHNAGPFYLVTFVRNLVEYLRKELRDNDIPGERVITHTEWGNGIITEWMGNRFGIAPEHRQISREPNYLLVDECQDLSLDEIRRLKQAARTAIFLYGDDEQQIMSFRTNPARIKQIGVELNVPIYRLRFNYRLPKKVASFAQEISGSGDLEKHCMNSDGDKPYVISMPTRDQQIATIVSLKDQNHYDEVGILCRTEPQVVEVFRQLQARGVSVSARYSLDDGNFSYIDPLTTFKVMNYHQAKGQQFEAVFLMLEDEAQCDRNLLYVGVTRTYHALYIIYQHVLPELLRSIPLDRYRSTLTEMDAPLVQV